MLYREIIAVCSEIHTKHTNTRCGLNVGFLNVVTPLGLEQFVTLVLYISDPFNWKASNISCRNSPVTTSADDQISPCCLHAGYSIINWTH